MTTTIYVRDESKEVWAKWSSDDGPVPDVGDFVYAQGKRGAVQINTRHIIVKRYFHPSAVADHSRRDIRVYCDGTGVLGADEFWSDE